MVNKLAAPVKPKACCVIGCVFKTNKNPPHVVLHNCFPPPNLLYVIGWIYINEQNLSKIHVQFNRT